MRIHFFVAIWRWYIRFVIWPNATVNAENRINKRVGKKIIFMKRFYLLSIVFLTSLGLNTKTHAQTQGVALEVFPLNPQSGQHNYFGVRVTLDQTYDENVIVYGYVYDAGGGSNQNHPFTLNVQPGILMAETTSTFYETDPTAAATAEIASVTPKTVSYYVYEFLNSPYFDTLLSAKAQYSMNIKGQLLQTGGSTLSSGYMQFLQTEGGVDSTDLSNYYIQNSLNDTLIRDQQCIVLAAYLKFRAVNIDFFESLSIEEQDQTFSNVFNTLKNESFITNNPNNILVQRIESIADRVNFGEAYINNNHMPIFAVSLLGPMYQILQYKKYRLTYEEVVDCVGDAVGGAVFAGLSSA